MPDGNRIQRFAWGTRDDAQVLIVHFGSKSTPMIAQQLRQIGMRSRVIHAADVPSEVAARRGARLTILSGGDDRVGNPGSPTIADADLAALRREGVVLGICYGAQLLASKLGGTVAPAAVPEFGEVKVNMIAPFGDYGGGTAVMNHSDEIAALPAGWKVFGSTAHCRHALVGADGVYAVVFHPEVDHTENGDAFLAHVALSLAGCERDYTLRPGHLRRHLHGMAAAGGAARRRGTGAFGRRGFGRAPTSWRSAPTVRACGRPAWIPVSCAMASWPRCGRYFGDADISYLEAADDFLPQVEALPYTGPDPQGEADYYDQVRRTIGARFIDTFVGHARRQGRRPAALVQGTNYADIIESITNLKAHHNVGGLPAQLDVQVVEPIAGLFKFEIRQLAAHLGLPEEVVHRQPSPGPGLAIRMWGPVTRSKVDALRRGTHVFEELVRLHYPEPRQRPTQYYLALAPLASCGLMGDDRVYGYAWVIRGVTTHDRESYVTVSAFDFSPAFLQEAARRLTNEITMDDGTRFVRVFVEVTGKPPSTTEPH